MNFNSPTYIFFFLAVVALYMFLDHKRQNRLLLIASYVFYSFWDWRFLGLIMLSTVTDYFTALAIDQSRERKRRKLFLGISLTVNLSVLCFFKYFNFFLDNLFALFSVFGLDLNTPVFKVILPIGISFYTFQSMSYTIDVYRQKLKPTHDILDYALFVSFFPQLVAGPIERAKNLLPQISRPRTIDPDQVNEGIWLIFWGLFKKMYVADNLPLLIMFLNNPLSSNDPAAQGGVILVTLYIYCFQLYADFSAYSDLARGSALVLGFDIMVNFRTPYLASNIQEFWGRWHISLTTWIRDYLYYPLALTRIRKKTLSPSLATLITFLIMGLWHGPSWNYVLWGGYHALLLILYGKLAPLIRKRTKGVKQPSGLGKVKPLSILVTFHFCVLGVVFFRYPTLEEIGFNLYNLFANFSLGPEVWFGLWQLTVYIAPLMLVEFMEFGREKFGWELKAPRLARYAFYYFLFYLLVVYRAIPENFIYFQF